MTKSAARVWGAITLLVAMLGVGCGAGDGVSLTPARAQEVDRAVRTFVHTVEAGITKDGPLGWHKYFANEPAFFMISDGQMAFPDGASAAKGIDALPAAYKLIELHWGDAIRIDPLTPSLAVMAAPFHENITAPSGERTEASGYFTATVEFQNGQWQFRNAHWSTAPHTEPRTK